MQHTPEQINLLRLLLSKEEINVVLGFELLKQREDQSDFVRALGLMASVECYEYAHRQAKTWLSGLLKEAWEPIAQELAIVELIYNQREGMHLSMAQALAAYQPHAAIYEQYMSLNVDYLEWYFYVSQELEAQGYKEEERYFLEQLLEHHPTAFYHERYAYALPKTPDTLQKRLYHLEQADVLASDMDNSHAFTLAELHYFEAHEVQQAMHWVEEGLKRDPGHPVGLNLKAVILHDQGQTAAAEQVYQKALQEDYYDPDALNDYANFLLSRCGDAPRALQVIQRAIEEEPEDDFYRLTLIEVYWYGLGDKDRALTLIKQLEQDGYGADELVQYKVDIAVGNRELPEF